jgi:hypothetical protein
MFTKNTPANPELDLVIAKIFFELRNHSPETEEYADITDQLSKLMKLKSELESSTKVSAETLATIAGNLAGILMILQFEKVHVVTTKALSFVMKLR